MKAVKASYGALVTALKGAGASFKLNIQLLVLLCLFCCEVYKRSDSSPALRSGYLCVAKVSRLQSTR